MRLVLKSKTVWSSMMISLLLVGGVPLLLNTLAGGPPGTENFLDVPTDEQSTAGLSSENGFNEFDKQAIQSAPSSGLHLSPPSSAQTKEARDPIPPSNSKKDQLSSNEKTMHRMGGAGKSSGRKARAVRKAIPPPGLDENGRPVFKYVWIKWTGNESSLFIEYAGILDAVLREEDLHDVQFERRLVLSKDANVAADRFISELDMYLDDEVTVSRPSGEFVQMQKGKTSLTPYQREQVSGFADFYYKKLKFAWEKAAILSNQTRKAPWDGGPGYEYSDEPVRFMSDVKQRRIFLDYVLQLIPEKELFLRSIFTREQWRKRKEHWDSKHIISQLNLFNESR